MDLRPQIPTWAVINHMVLMEAAGTPEYKQRVHAVEESLGLQQDALRGKYINFGHTASLLYCLIVVPKEVWPLESESEIYRTLDSRGLADLFTVELSTPQFSEHPSYLVIRALRNAVAHVRFSLTDDEVFTFWDQKGAKKDPYFRASISLAQLGRFLAEVAKVFDSLRVSAERLGPDPGSVRSLQRKLMPDIVGLEQLEPTSLRGIANRRWVYAVCAEASTT